MYIKYLPINATGQQVFEDLCALLTGASIASLSASCDKVNSSVLASSIAMNWTMHDAAASASSKVLKSLNADGVSYKYLNISYVTTTITLQLYESWNAGTHVGTNPAIYATAVQAGPQLLTTTTVGFTLWSSSRNLILSQGASRTIYVGEFSRDSKTLDSTYPCTFIAGGNAANYIVGYTGVTPTATGMSYAGLCRIKYASSAGDLKSASTPSYPYPIAAMHIQGSDPYDHLISTTNIASIRPAGTELQTYLVFPIFLSCSLGVASMQHTLGKIPELKSIRYTANFLDEITLDGTTYIMFGSVLAPKG